MRKQFHLQIYVLLGAFAFCILALSQSATAANAETAESMRLKLNDKPNTRTMDARSILPFKKIVPIFVSAAPTIDPQPWPVRFRFSITGWYFDQKWPDGSITVALSNGPSHTWTTTEQSNHVYEHEWTENLLAGTYEGVLIVALNRGDHVNFMCYGPHLCGADVLGGSKDEPLNATIPIQFTIIEVITATPQIPCVNQEVKFTYHNNIPDELLHVDWSGGGEPPTGEGRNFTTKYTGHGGHTVRADWNDPSTSGTDTLLIDVADRCPGPIKVEPAKPCPNEKVKFTLEGAPDDLEVKWSGAGYPATGTGKTFTTQFRNHGTFPVSATWNGSGSGNETAYVTVNELSGAQWPDKPEYPKSSDPATLKEPFKPNLEEFLKVLKPALKKAKSTYFKITSTYRPPERAYLMHWSWRIAKKDFDPSKAGTHPNVPICWSHRKMDGTIDRKKSKEAATEMLKPLDIAGLKTVPALKGRHTQGHAIDMVFDWQGNLEIKPRKGPIKTIDSTPRSGMNQDLWKVAATYGVEKFFHWVPKPPPNACEPGATWAGCDEPHWSTDGR